MLLGCCTLIKSTSGSLTALCRTDKTKDKADVPIGVYSTGSSGLWLNWYMTDTMHKNIFSLHINKLLLFFWSGPSRRGNISHGCCGCKRP